MLVSQKCQYALFALFHLAQRYQQGPVKIADIAKAQGIPLRFLEVILPQVKQGRFVDSRRGQIGGYFLTQDPKTLTVGEVIVFLEGSMQPVKSLKGNTGEASIVFEPLWDEVMVAISSVYENTTFQDLIDRYQKIKQDYVPSWSI